MLLNREDPSILSCGLLEIQRKNPAYTKATKILEQILFALQKGHRVTDDDIKP
ncbi:MAG: hypothetical protein ACJ72Q_14200 [Nitrososphaeraceae archaeon]